MRFLLSAVVGLIVVLAAAVLVVPSVVDWKPVQGRDRAARRGAHRPPAGDRRKRRDRVAAGRPLSSARDVRLANIDGGTAADMVRLAFLEARVALGPLITGNIQVETIKLVEPVFELEILADDRKNWEFPPPATPTTQPSDAVDGKPDATDEAAAEAAEPNVRLDNFVVENGTVVFRDRTTGREERLAGINARFAAASLSGPFESAGEIVVRGVPLGFEATVGRIIHGRTVPLDVALTAANGAIEVQLNGTAVGLATKPKFKGTLKASGGNLAELVRFAAGDGRLPGFLAQAFRFETEVVASADRADVRNLALSLGETQATGEATMTFADTADIRRQARRPPREHGRVAGDAAGGGRVLAQACAGGRKPRAGKGTTADHAHRSSLRRAPCRRHSRPRRSRSRCPPE